MRWAKHFGMWFALAVTASAVPVKPDLQKILQEQSERPKYYEPARAGWNGPEMMRPQEAAPNPFYEAYGPASTVRMIRASLAEAAMPNPAAMAAIGLLILLLRYSRSRRLQRGQARVVPIRTATTERQRAA